MITQRHPSLRSLFTLLGLLLIFSIGGTAYADCPRGDLDERYCDYEGDLVADTPEDPELQKDPPVLIFSASPGEDPATYRGAWTEFLAHVEDITGKRTDFFTVGSFGAQVEALRAGRIHIAGVPTGAVPTAVNQGGFVPKVMMAQPDGSYGYTMAIITQHDNDAINSLEDLEGQTVAFVSPESNSGYMAPAALLFAELNMIPGESYQTTFSGSHDNSILGIANYDYEVAAIADSVLRRMAQEGFVDYDDFKIVYESQPFPPVAFGVAHDLKPELAQQITEAFLTFDWEGTELERQYAETDGSTFIEITYREHWQVIRDVEAGLAEIED